MLNFLVSAFVLFLFWLYFRISLIIQMGRVLSKFVCIFGCISLRFSLHLYFVFRIFFWRISQNIVYFYLIRYCLAFTSVCFSMNRNDLDSGYRRLLPKLLLNISYSASRKFLQGNPRKNLIYLGIV